MAKYDPDEFFNRRKPTNGDAIRAMSDEELAKWIDVYLYRDPWCKDNAPVDPATRECLVHDACWECVLDWLKAEAK